jgi:threonine dehydrogenase-like Zn-dependent dehydrogenase
VFAAVTRSPGDIVGDIPEPGSPRAGRVVVRPEGVGIRGRDLHLFSGHTGALSDAWDFFATIQGHEVDGGLQERLEVKANAASPAGDLDAGDAAFAKPMPSAVHALRRAGPSAGEGGTGRGEALVLGAVPIGLAAVLATPAAGLHVMVADPEAPRADPFWRGHGADAPLEPGVPTGLRRGGEAARLRGSSYRTGRRRGCC